MNLINADCWDAMFEMEDNSVDAIVTDPPYGLSFMGKKWDYDVPAVIIWQEAIRVLKPGGYMLCACGTRTQHRMTINIEDAGFEIRDVISWIYGSGFPKSLDVSKAIDKQAGVEREVIGTKDVGPDIRGDNYKRDSGERMIANITEAATDEAKQWNGYGTALKPAQELWTLARKPLSEKTVAENVLKHGTGGINIDGCRVTMSEDDKEMLEAKSSKNPTGKKAENVPFVEGIASRPHDAGRFPANVIFDEFMGGELDKQSGVRKSGGAVKESSLKYGGYEQKGINKVYGKGLNSATPNTAPYLDSGGASRFFYCAKASKSERNAGLENFAPTTTTTTDGRAKSIDNAYLRGETERQNNHPTVKPIKLMEYLIKLITPIDGTVLDPFMGSGTTGLAAKNLGRNFIGIERDPNYFKICQGRIL